MFSRFPKVRPELPDNFKFIYAEQYKRNRDGSSTASSLAQKVESWMHRQVSNDLNLKPRVESSTLEIGAGTLNHLKYERNYQNLYDIVEPLAFLYENTADKQYIRTVYTDVSEIPTSIKYDRIISIATFEHILNLPEVVKQCVDLLKPEGCLRIAIPNEGNWLWSLGWKLTTGLEFKFKYGLDYGILMKHEHVNTADEIAEILKFFFKKTKVSYFGIGKFCSLYRFYECQN